MFHPRVFLIESRNHYYRAYAKRSYQVNIMSGHHGLYIRLRPSWYKMISNVNFKRWNIACVYIDRSYNNSIQRAISLHVCTVQICLPLSLQCRTMPCHIGDVLITTGWRTYRTDLHTSHVMTIMPNVKVSITRTESANSACNCPQ